MTLVDLTNIIADVRAILKAKEVAVTEADAYIDELPDGKDLYVIQIGTADRMVEARLADKENDFWTIMGIGDGFQSYKQWQEFGRVFAALEPGADVVEPMAAYLTEEGAYK